MIKKFLVKLGRKKLQEIVYKKESHGIICCGILLYYLSTKVTVVQSNSYFSTSSGTIQINSRYYNFHMNKVNHIDR